MWNALPRHSDVASERTRVVDAAMEIVRKRKPVVVSVLARVSINNSFNDILRDLEELKK